MRESVSDQPLSIAGRIIARPVNSPLDRGRRTRSPGARTASHRAFFASGCGESFAGIIRFACSRPASCSVRGAVGIKACVHRFRVADSFRSNRSGARHRRDRRARANADRCHRRGDRSAQRGRDRLPCTLRPYRTRPGSSSSIRFRYFRRLRPYWRGRAVP